MAFDINLLSSSLEDHVPAMRQDFAWVLCRLSHSEGLFTTTDDPQLIPSWTAFNAIIRQNHVPIQSNIGYLQMIDASPTELSTVYTLMKRSLDLADQLSQEDAIIVVDQAIYAKVMEIIWKNPQEFNRLIPRLGAFHTCCTFLAVIGKRFAESGLNDLLIESEVCAAGSLRGVMEGRHYNRAVRIHKIVLEALLRIRLSSFQTWLQESNMTVDDASLCELIQLIRNDSSEGNLELLLQHPEFIQLHEAYMDFRNSDQGAMSRYWGSYIDMVELLLRFIRSTREGNWQLHLACLQGIMPWFFAYDRTNYARFTPVYWCQMQLLSHTHPEAHQKLSEGEFAVQMSNTNGFGQIPVDQTIEETINRDSKVKGGIIGFSQKKNTVQRWILTAHERAEFTQLCRRLAGLTRNSQNKHKQASKSRMKKDENDVQKVQSILLGWGNPFEPGEDIKHLASGVTVSSVVSEDLENAEEKGRELLNKFVTDRLVAENVHYIVPFQSFS